MTDCAKCSGPLESFRIFDKRNIQIVLVIFVFHNWIQNDNSMSNFKYTFNVGNLKCQIVRSNLGYWQNFQFLTTKIFNIHIVLGISEFHNQVLNWQLDVNFEMYYLAGNSWWQIVRSVLGYCNIFEVLTTKAFKLSNGFPSSMTEFRSDNSMAIFKCIIS